jgi:hypothetical protein
LSNLVQLLLHPQPMLVSFLDSRGKVIEIEIGLDCAVRHSSGNGHVAAGLRLLVFVWVGQDEMLNRAVGSRVCGRMTVSWSVGETQIVTGRGVRYGRSSASGESSKCAARVAGDAKAVDRAGAERLDG